MNTFSRSLFLALLATTGAFAAKAPATSAPSTNAAPAAPAFPKSAKVTAAPAKPASILDDYINELTTALKLTDSEKKDIEADYTDDGDLLKNILNNDALSPLEQAREVSAARDARNTKIEELLMDNDRKQAFLKIEAKYRVALTEFAANGGLVPPPTPPPPPAAPATSASTTMATNAPAATPAKAGTTADKAATK